MWVLTHGGRDIDLLLWSDAGVGLLIGILTITIQCSETAGPKQGLMYVPMALLLKFELSFFIARLILFQVDRVFPLTFWIGNIANLSLGIIGILL